MSSNRPHQEEEVRRRREEQYRKRRNASKKRRGGFGGLKCSFFHFWTLSHTSVPFLLPLYIEFIVPTRLHERAGTVSKISSQKVNEGREGGWPPARSITSFPFFLNIFSVLIQGCMLIVINRFLTSIDYVHAYVYDDRGYCMYFNINKVSKRDREIIVDLTDTRGAILRILIKTLQILMILWYFESSNDVGHASRC